MAAPLSQDLRRSLVPAIEAGSSVREVARGFAVNRSAAIKLVRRVRETGSTAPAQAAPRPFFKCGDGQRLIPPQRVT